MQNMSIQAMEIVAKMRTVFAALDEHKSGVERDAIYAAIAAHVRSASPLALTGAADLQDPAAELRIPLAGGAFIEITPGLLYVVEASGKDAAASLTDAQREEVAGALRRVR